MLEKQMSFIVGIATCVSFGTLMPPQSRRDVVVQRRIQLESGCEKRRQVGLSGDFQQHLLVDASRIDRGQIDPKQSE